MAAAPLDLTKAIPPGVPMLDQALSATLSGLCGERDLGTRIRVNRPGGNAQDREAAASWLSCRFTPSPPPERIIVTNGTQSVLGLILQHLAKPGDLIVAEQLTYVVLRQIVNRLGMRLEGIPLDGSGLMPEAFEAVCKMKRPKALYCNPTVHNPTASVMPESRRAALADIARRYEVAIIEDDVLGALHGPTPRPICAIAPDVTWYCMSLSKCFALGLRLAYVLAPSQSAASALVSQVQNLSSWFPSALSLMVVADWIRSGVGLQIAAAMHEEMMERQKLAALLLGNFDYNTASGALHVWLQLPASCDPLSFTKTALQAGVAIRPAGLFSVDSSAPPNAVRVSLSSPSNRSDLATGLLRIAALMEKDAIASE